MAPLPAVIGVLAHGGNWGIAVEIASALGIVLLGLAVWVGNRKERSGEDTDE